MAENDSIHRRGRLLAPFSTVGISVRSSGRTYLCVEYRGKPDELISAGLVSAEAFKLVRGRHCPGVDHRGEYNIYLAPTTPCPDRRRLSRRVTHECEWSFRGCAICFLKDYRLQQKNRLS